MLKQFWIRTLVALTVFSILTTIAYFLGLLD